MCVFELKLPLYRGTEEVFQILDDNQVTLSTMKASRYVKAFEKEVDHWERKLSHVLEVIEMILQIQRQWMYLEVHKLYFGVDSDIDVCFACLEHFCGRRYSEATAKGDC